jgi:hypothetical protein
VCVDERFFGGRLDYYLVLVTWHVAGERLKAFVAWHFPSTDSDRTERIQKPNRYAASCGARLSSRAALARAVRIGAMRIVIDAAEISHVVAVGLSGAFGRVAARWPDSTQACAFSFPSWGWTLAEYA